MSKPKARRVTGLLAGTAYAAEPIAALARRRRQRGSQSAKKRRD
jgi:hypothetical protein